MVVMQGLAKQGLAKHARLPGVLGGRRRSTLEVAQWVNGSTFVSQSPCTMPEGALRSKWC